MSVRPSTRHQPAQLPTTTRTWTNSSFIVSSSSSSLLMLLRRGISQAAKLFCCDGQKKVDSPRGLLFRLLLLLLLVGRLFDDAMRHDDTITRHDAIEGEEEKVLFLLFCRWRNPSRVKLNWTQKLCLSVCLSVWWWWSDENGTEWDDDDDRSRLHLLRVVPYSRRRRFNFVQ